MSTGRTLKKQVLKLLGEPDWRSHLEQLAAENPVKALISPLFSSLLNKDPLVKWRGVVGFGLLVGQKLAADQLEKARIVIRRLMWSLNDESGGIGWGAPEAMAEIMAQNPRLAEEYSSILRNYLREREDGPENFLELPELRRGALWGVARLAQANPGHAEDSIPDMIANLDSEDPETVGIALWGLGSLKAVQAKDMVEKHVGRQEKVRLFIDEEFVEKDLGQLARTAIEAMEV